MPRFTYHHFLPCSSLGGGEITALRLAGDLAGQGRRQIIWTPGEGPAARSARYEGLECETYPLIRLRGNRLSQAWSGAGLLPRLCRRKPGLAHLHTPFLYGFLRPVLRLARMPAVVHVQIEPSGEEVEWVLREPPAAIVACAEFIAGQIRDAADRLGKRVTIATVPNSVDVNRYHSGGAIEDKRRVGAPLDRPLVLMLANLAPHKGQETALRALAELKRRGRTVEGWFAGEERGGGTGYGARLERLANELGIHEQVQFLGFRCDGPELLRAADVLLLPSTHEGLPLTLVEAQASRVPVIAAPTAGVPEIVRHGQTGLLVPANDHQGYAAAIFRLLDEPNFREQIVEQAYCQATTDYSWARFLERIEEIYASVHADHQDRELNRHSMSPHAGSTAKTAGVGA